MARNGSGTYVAPAGNPVVSNTVIQASWANNLVTDLGTELTNSLPRDGQAPMLAAFKSVDGTAAAPGLTFNSDSNSGLFKPATAILGFSISGGEQMRLISGSLLLGQTSSTGERLQITGDVKVTGNQSLTSNLTIGGNATITGTTTPSGSVVFGANYTELSTAITATATTTINCSLGNCFAVAMNASITTLTISNVPASGRVYSLSLFLKQDATGSRTVTWPAAVKWVGGSAPTLTTTANKLDIVTLVTYDGGTTWYASSALNF